MKNEFVPYDIALAMKELGFDEECFGCFTKDKKLSLDYSTNKGEGHYFQDCAAPLYQQAFRWFREKYDLVSEIQAPDGKDGKWNPTIHKVYGFGNHYDNDGFKTYEETELACLRKLIEIVRNYNQYKEDE
tara:strand:+ start:1378 stop:1767 length:390 start_codon:yes stop_codon:yes gene_type:complete